MDSEYEWIQYRRQTAEAAEIALTTESDPAAVGFEDLMATVREYRRIVGEVIPSPKSTLTLARHPCP